MRRMSFDVGEVSEGLENEQSLLLQALPSLYLSHSSFSNPSVASPMSQLIFLPLRPFTYVKVHSRILLSLHLCHGHFTYVIWPATRGITLVLKAGVVFFNYNKFILSITRFQNTWQYSRKISTKFFKY